MRFIANIIYKILGWKLVGEYPREIKKKILIVVPHTSNWDFPLGILARSLMRDKIQYVGKKEMFDHPFGWLLKAMGGIPIDRKKSKNFVRSVVDEYDKRESLTIQIAPEGTRKKVKKLKTGFYYIAKTAGIPIIPVIFDYKLKEVKILDTFFPSDNAEKDIENIENLMRGYQGKIPQNSF